VQEGHTGALAAPDDVESLVAAVRRARRIDRQHCRAWAERHCSQQAFAARIEAWLEAVAGPTLPRR
jgi:UDP-glucose:tetrahydrobiopterin glucosyltransferase